MKKARKYIEYISRILGREAFLVLLILLFIAAITGLQAQDSKGWKEALKDELQSNTNVEYLHLLGYFEDGVLAEFFFAYDSIDWVGHVNYPDNGLQFKLEGFKNGDLLNFNEYTDDERQSGYWQIEKKRNLFHAKWSNLNLSMDFELVLYDAFWNPGFKKNYHKLINTYEGELSGVPVQLEITRDHNSPLSMEWNDKAATFRIKTAWDCLDPFCKQFRIEGINLDEKQDSLYALLDDEELFIYTDGKENRDSIVLFKRSDTRFTQIHSIIDVNYKLVVEFPYFHEGRIRKVVEKSYMEIFNSLKDSLALVSDVEAEMGDRWRYFANAWLVIDFWDDYLISGRWVMQNSWNDSRLSYPINYSLRDEKFIVLKDQFKAGFDLDFYLLHFIQKGIKEMPEYRNPLLRNKLNKANFKHTSLCKAGLLLSTEFDTTTGSFQLMIPYSEIRQYLKKRSELNKWLQSRFDG